MRIERVGIVGAGTMGSGIAMVSALQGCAVTLVDQRTETALSAVEAGKSFFARQAERSRISAEEAARARGRLKSAGSLESLADADLVIEAVFEDFNLKLRVLRDIASVLRPDAMIATNTSCLRVSELALAVPNPRRFVGLHYFSPAQVNPIVEVVSGAETGDTTVESAVAFCRATGKTPILCKDQYGFAINRFFCPYTNEAVRAMDDGLGTAGEIDLVARDALGAAAGPFSVMNLIKPRINLHAIRNLGPLGAFYAPAASMVATGEADRSWPVDDATLPRPDRARQIADRLLGGTFLPVLQELDEAVAEPKSIDMGAREALKLAKPPCALMDSLGPDEVMRILAPFLARFDLNMPRSMDRVGQLTASI